MSHRRRSYSHLISSFLNNRALEAPEIPPEILHTLLNLAEFLEHNQDPLPMPITHKLLGDLAEKNHAYAKVWFCGSF